jgi:hypothetical protein
MEHPHPTNCRQSKQIIMPDVTGIFDDVIFSKSTV